MGKYKRRFARVTTLLDGLPPEAKVLELCFGDVYIADFCRKKGLKWTGFDINENFVRQARSRGYDAHLKDITAIEALPKGDVCIMMGSLYHFHPKAEVMLARMLAASDSVIISEPVLNLSSSGGLIGFLASRAANAGKGHEQFRFNKNSFLNLLKNNSGILNCRIESSYDEGKDLVVKLVKND